MITYYPDYLYGVQIDSVDNEKLFNHCLTIETALDHITPPVKDTGWYGNKSSANNSYYNLFTFPVGELNQLYTELVKNITPLLDPNKRYVLKSWMNVYRAGQNVQWHKHWPPEFEVWHGFYCVKVGESSTQYKIPGAPDVITIKSEPGLLVIGKSDGDLHKSTEWNVKEYPRITLAFDIIPIDKLNPTEDFIGVVINHYIPFK